MKTGNDSARLELMILLKWKECVTFFFFENPIINDEHKPGGLFPSNMYNGAIKTFILGGIGFLKYSSIMST